MNSFFNENRRSAILLLVVLIVAVVTLFFLLVWPMMQDLESSESNLATTESERRVLETRLDKLSALPEEDVERLRFLNEVPITPDLEDIIRTIEEIEMKSGSRIDSIDFGYDDFVPEPIVTEEEEAETAEQAADPTDEAAEEALEEPAETEDADEEEEEDGAEAPIFLEELPEQLHAITIQVELFAPDFDSHQAFLKGIEEAERMYMVSSVEFKQPSEADLVQVDDPDETVESKLTIHAFYYEADE